ncbi:sialidase-3-like [Silurus meridionalis]|uniref:sialidase-3-like n=1 Tax=Silurus meridionalis TaxID=175797 RepID=UPI001EEACAE4|nr:sialidase-3-like [Silurus meridionalis]
MQINNTHVRVYIYPEEVLFRGDCSLVHLLWGSSTISTLQKSIDQELKKHCGEMGNCVSTNSSCSLTPIQTDVHFTNTMYRIPALIYIKENETFLAFAEKRTSLNDANAKNLVVKRGIKQNESIKWSPLEELPDAGLEGYRTMNPCPVYENISKSVFLFFICVFDKVTEKEQIDSRKNRARLCYVFSQDGGNSWSKTTDLTEAVIGEEIKNWATFAVGPGHGIQMSSNRLIIPAYVYYITCCCVKPYAFAFYSDDSGESWHYGEKLSKESLECEMAEITDDTGNKILYCNARSTRGCRVEAWSKDQEIHLKHPITVI